MRVDKAAKEWEEDDTRLRRWFPPDKARKLLPHDVMRKLLDGAIARLLTAGREELGY